MFSILSPERSDPKVAGLRHAAIFAGRSKKELDFVATHMDEVTVPQGQRLTTEGAPGHGFYLLVEGEVAASIAGNVVAKLGPGDFFGEISMLDRGPATATITTLTDSRLLAMSHEQFRDAIRGQGDIRSDIMAAVEERLRANATAGYRRKAREL